MATTQSGHNNPYETGQTLRPPFQSHDPGGPEERGCVQHDAGLQGEAPSSCFRCCPPTVAPPRVGRLRWLLSSWPCPHPPHTPPRCLGVCPFPEPQPLLSFSLQLLFLWSLRPSPPFWGPPGLPLSQALPPLFLFLVGPAAPIVHSQERAVLLVGVEGGVRDLSQKESWCRKPLPAPTHPQLYSQQGAPTPTPLPVSFLEISLSKLVSSSNLTPTCGG